MYLPTSCSVRSSSPDRSLLTSPHVLCTHARSLRWHGALRLSLWHAALRHAASLKAYLCQSCSRAAPARAGVRCRLALRPEVLAVCMVAVSAIARAVSEPPFRLPFEPEALSRCMWRVAGEICAAVRALWVGCASVERACGASASLMCIVSAFCTRASSAQ